MFSDRSIIVHKFGHKDRKRIILCTGEEINFIDSGSIHKMKHHGKVVTNVWKKVNCAECLRYDINEAFFKKDIDYDGIKI